MISLSIWAFGFAQLTVTVKVVSQQPYDSKKLSL